MTPSCFPLPAKSPQINFDLKKLSPKFELKSCLTLASSGPDIPIASSRGDKRTPLAVRPLAELELRGKNERIARYET